MAYITKKKPSPVGDKPKEDKIEKPTSKWIQKKEKPTSKWIQKKEGLKKDKRKTMFESFQERASEEPRRNMNPPTPKDKRELRPVKGARSWRKIPPQDRPNMNIGGRANLLEEMGRIDARRHPDAADRAEKRRVIGELNRGYNKGGLVIKGKPKLAKKGWK